MIPILEYIKKTKTSSYYGDTKISRNMSTDDVLDVILDKFNIENVEDLGDNLSADTTKFITNTHRTAVGVATTKSSIYDKIIYLVINDGSMFSLIFKNNHIVRASYVGHGYYIDGDDIDKTIEKFNSL